VLVPAGDGGLADESVALYHQIRVSDASRLRQRLGRLSDATIAQVTQAVHVTLAT